MAFVRITQLDGKLPNLALMRIAAWRRALGDEIIFTRSPYRHLDEPDYSAVYGSAIFKFTSERVARFKAEFPQAVIGGTWAKSDLVIENLPGFEDCGVDYSLDPKFDLSMGFSQRGCRLRCSFCVVPWKEGKPRHAGTISEIWRGAGHKKHIMLLDNDFFGGPYWRERIAEIREGDFKVCFSQGINIRLVNDEVAEALASIKYRGNCFTKKRLYTAWDNLKDEKVFFRGVDCLERHGIPPTHLTAYMLIGSDKRETWERIHYRVNAMIARGIEPYPMPFDQTNVEHKRFQRWAVRHAYRKHPFDQYTTNAAARQVVASHPDLFGAA